MVQDKKIAIIGLGYVGLPLAVEFGKTRSTLGFDISTRRIDELRLGRDSTLEVTEEEMTSASHLAFSCDANDLGDCSIFIVTVPTPIDDVNRPDLTPILRQVRPLQKRLRLVILLFMSPPFFRVVQKKFVFLFLKGCPDLPITKTFSVATALRELIRVIKLTR